MLKTPVSILQELTVMKRIAAPDYQHLGTGESHCMSFTCHVKADAQTAVGTGNTKKDAKHDAARNMLKLFGVKLDDEPQNMSQMCLLPSKSNKSDGPMINYVGKLNEYCSGHRHPQPAYTDGVTVQNAQFCVTCTFNSFRTEGYGFNKKDAKQDSAKKMLAMVKDGGIEDIPVEAVHTKFEENNEITEQVLQKYNELVKDLTIHEKRDDNNVASVGREKVNLSSWDELIELLDKHGYAHELSTFQKYPLILVLKINEHVLMQYGNSRDEVQNKFVKNVVEMLRNGVDFSKPLLDI